MLTAGMICALAAAVVAGVISPTLAQGAENPFYLMTKNLELLGIAQRFEAVVSAAMTVGWFSLICLLLSLGGRYAQKMNANWSRAGALVAAATAGAGMLFKLHISWWIVGLLAAVFWVFLPLITQGLVRGKKS